MEKETVNEEEREEAAQAGGGWKLESLARSESPTESFSEVGNGAEPRASGVSPRTSLALVVVISAALALTLAALPPLSTPGTAPLAA